MVLSTDQKAVQWRLGISGPSVLDTPENLHIKISPWYEVLEPRDMFLLQSVGTYVPNYMSTYPTRPYSLTFTAVRISNLINLR